MENDGVVALRRLKSSDPPLYLSPSPDISAVARLASQYLYSSLKPFTPRSPFAQLLTDGFDAEQIWQQIDLQSEPLVSSLRRRVSHFEKNPETISEQFNVESTGLKRESRSLDDLDREREDIEDADLDDFDEDDEEDEEEQEADEDDDDEEEKGEGSEEEEEEEEEEDDDGTGLVEDQFLKIKELEKFLADDEAREYGFEKDVKMKKRKRVVKSGTDEEHEEGEEDDALEDVDLDDDVSDEDGDIETARYEDFFERKGTDHNKKPKAINRSHNMETNEEITDDGDDDGDYQGNQNLSTHERELLKLRSTIEEMEKANIEPKAWTMQGEVTAAKRPKNSALEVDLDFEHNVRPAPVITEEVTLSLEELIRKRILEEQFDDVQKPSSLPSRAPRERKELDDNKSKKGLAEVYEDEYIQKTGLVSTAMSFSDEQKKEAAMLFKKLSFKLDALSHFHFAPKPVIEDMSIQTNVPALAMEEIAPVAISDAAMLAPEEVFTGKRDTKEETELTQAERKRRRAKKKRKFKGEALKRKAPPNKLLTGSESKEQL